MVCRLTVARDGTGCVKEDKYVGVKRLWQTKAENKNFINVV